MTEYGWTPLLTAVNNRNYQLAKLLLERGADPNLANKGGWTPLYLATDNRNIEGGDYPVPKADMDHLEIIRLLLEKGANPNARIKDNTLTRTIFTMQWFFEDGATPFIRAVAVERHRADEAAAEARRRSEDRDHPRRQRADRVVGGIGWVEGVTYERSAKENFEAMRMLLDLGLDPNYANNDGRTALMGAAMKGRSDVMQLLVDRGAKLDAHDKGSRDTDKVSSAAAGHTLAGDRLRRRPGARRRAVGRRAAGDGGAHSQADGRARHAGAADRPHHPLGLRRRALPGDEPVGRVSGPPVRAA